MKKINYIWYSFLPIIFINTSIYPLNLLTHMSRHQGSASCKNPPTLTITCHQCGEQKQVHGRNNSKLDHDCTDRTNISITGKFVCALCNSEFIDRPQLIHHIIMLHNPEKCPYCHITLQPYDNPESIKDHFMRPKQKSFLFCKNLPKINISCLKCNTHETTYDDDRYREAHAKNSDKECTKSPSDYNISNEIPCYYCDKRYHRLLTFRKHIIYQHILLDNITICPYCNDPFTTNNNTTQPDAPTKKRKKSPLQRSKKLQKKDHDNTTSLSDLTEIIKLVPTAPIAPFGQMENIITPYVLSIGVYNDNTLLK